MSVHAYISIFKCQRLYIGGFEDLQQNPSSEPQCFRVVSDSAEGRVSWDEIVQFVGLKGEVWGEEKGGRG